MKERFQGPLDLVELSPLMEATSGAPEIKVGLIDGPIALDHPALSKSHIRDLAIDGGGACARQTSAGCVHGTFVAGVLSATRNGVAPAICPNCTLLVRAIFARLSPWAPGAKRHARGTGSGDRRSVAAAHACST
jgi:hypothetical protein